MTWALLLVAASASTGWVVMPGGALRREWSPFVAVRPVHSFGLLAVMLAPFLGLQSVLVGVAGAALTAAVRTLLSHARSRRLRRGRELAVIELCDALAAELASGVPALVALERACNVHPELAVVGRSARLGVEVPTTLHELARQPGLEALRAVAAGWRVASHTGGGLAEVLDNIGHGLRHAEDARSELEAALGPPRATARMLAVLPLFGLVLGQSMGASPFRFLLLTTSGRACLVVGLVLSAAGIVWVDLIARQARERP